MKLGQSGLETRLGGILAQNAVEVEGWGNPLSGIPCTQIGTTVAATGPAMAKAFSNYSNDDLVGVKMIFISNKSRELTIVSRTSNISVEVDIPAVVTVPTDVLLYRSSPDPATSLVRMMTKNIEDPLNGTVFAYNADTKRMVPRSRSETFTDTTTGAVPLALGTLELPENSHISFDVSISAKRTDDVGFGAFRISGECTRGVGPETVELYGSEVIVMDRDAPQWAVEIEIDLTIGGLRPLVVGKMANTLDWEAMVTYVLK